MNAKTEGIRIVFRGVRGSYPMPGPTTLRYGGNTSCQEVRAGERLLILDAGTGIIALGHELEAQRTPAEMALFFSHSHHDHTGGLLFFKPAYNPKTTLHIFGPREGQGTILDSLENLSSAVVHPVRLKRMGMRFDCSALDGGEALLWRAGEDGGPVAMQQGEAADPGDVVVRVLRNSQHPIDGVLNFRVEHGGKSYVYATDIEAASDDGCRALADFARGADLLAHDGQYEAGEYEAEHKGWGHSTVDMAIRTAELAGVKRLAIIHHEPGYGDDKLERMESAAQEKFPNLFFAREGQAVEL